ncbi:hypothetical protein HYDPIDRAFT_118173 [Hydnomerulius pinastri MD-312]|uniref:Uncharacterized protein n=1 Tax=Hydnomerulius pinastri MD-312 TaxID=994086 RepID=A0A0C9V340_9AGAM|nr:hypothetical protein HYDPIDRAFT_118173 [Hydnomerulius pinastri MD-312]
MLEDVIFLEVDGILPNWKTYGFKLIIDTPGVKTVVFRFKDGADIKKEKKETKTEDMQILHDLEEVDGVKIKVEEEEVKLTWDDYEKKLDTPPPSPKPITVYPSTRLSQRTGNPRASDPGKLSDKPWRYIIRSASTSDLHATARNDSEAPSSSAGPSSHRRSERLKRRKL